MPLVPPNKNLPMNKVYTKDDEKIVALKVEILFILDFIF